MTISKIPMAAFLAGATTLSVSLPAFAAERQFDLTGFDQVEVSAGLSVQVEIGPEFAVSAEAGSERTLKRLDITVRGNKLIVTRDGSWTDFSLFAARRDATITIKLPDLSAIQATAGSDVNVSGEFGQSLKAVTSSGAELDLDNVTGDVLHFVASSGSELNAGGQCTNLEIETSSGASVHTSDLACSLVEASASSGSDIRAHATDRVVASASSGGGIRISGEPENVEENESSGGSVWVK